MRSYAYLDPRAQLGQGVVLGPGCQVLGPSVIGDGCVLGSGVVIGHPSKATLLASHDLRASTGARLGCRCIVRSGTVVYEGAEIGDDLQAGHNVVVRERARLGRNCALGSGTVIEWETQVGDNARLQSNVVAGETGRIGHNVFIGPMACLTTGRYMLSALVAGGKLTEAEFREAERRSFEAPPYVIEDDVRIGALAVVLAWVRLGRGCVVGAGAVVCNDVPPGGLVVGNPARLIKRLAEGQLHGTR